VWSTGTSERPTNSAPIPGTGDDGNETRGGPDIQLIRPQELSFAPDGRAAGVGGTA
jgi:hypothetical protein